jgi:hypothetical protein
MDAKRNDVEMGLPRWLTAVGMEGSRVNAQRVVDSEDPALMVMSKELQRGPAIEEGLSLLAVEQPAGRVMAEGDAEGPRAAGQALELPEPKHQAAVATVVLGVRDDGRVQANYLKRVAFQACRASKEFAGIIDSVSPGKLGALSGAFEAVCEAEVVLLKRRKERAVGLGIAEVAAKPLRGIGLTPLAHMISKALAELAPRDSGAINIVIPRDTPSAPLGEVELLAELLKPMAGRLELRLLPSGSDVAGDEDARQRLEGVAPEPPQVMNELGPQVMVKVNMRDELVLV